MNFEKVAVIGSGTMGSGIAQTLSQAGLKVVLTDVEQSFVDKGLANIKRMYESRVRKETLSQSEADRLFGLVIGSTKDEDLATVDLVIEAALEKIEVKTEIFRKFDKLCPPHTVLASNTSSLSISEIAAATKRPAKVLGLHFFNPAQVMKLVEVIPGVKTDPQVVTSALELCKKIGKIPVKVNECPGFLVNRLLFPYINEALYVLQEGQFAPEEVDDAAVAFGLPMGPFALLDMTGLDVCAHVNQFLNDEYGIRFATAPVLPALVKHGFLGQKTKAGVYLHESERPQSKEEKKQLNPRLGEVLKGLESASALEKQKAQTGEPFDVYRLILPMFNEAMFSLQENIVALNDLDVAMLHGTGLKRGLLSIANEKGLPWCHEKLEQYRTGKGERFRPSWYLSKLVRAGLQDFRELAPVPVAVK